MEDDFIIHMSKAQLRIMRNQRNDITEIFRKFPPLDSWRAVGILEDIKSRERSLLKQIYARQ